MSLLSNRNSESIQKIDHRTLYIHTYVYLTNSLHDRNLCFAFFIWSQKHMENPAFIFTREQKQMEKMKTWYYLSKHVANVCDMFASLQLPYTVYILIYAYVINAYVTQCICVRILYVYVNIWVTYVYIYLYVRVTVLYLFLGGVWELLFLGSTMVLINFLVHGKCEISSNFGQSYFEFDVKTWTSPDLLPNRFGSNQNLFSEKQFESKIHSIVKNDAVIWHEIETDFI